MVTALPENLEAIGEAGVTIRADDDSLSSALRRLAENPSERAQLGERASVVSRSCSVRPRCARERMRCTTTCWLNGGALTTGSHERRLAIGALAQQLSGIASALAMFVAITVLARSLSLGELGTYGLLVSFATYLIFVQGSIEIAAVKAIAEAQDAGRRNEAFSTAFSLYVVAGVAVGAVTAVAGIAALGLFDIPARLHHDAEVGVIALGLVTAVGWPMKTFLDLLRGTQRFVSAAVAEGVGIVVDGTLLVVLTLVGAPLWALVAVGGGIPLFVGVASVMVVLVGRVSFRFDRRAVSRESIRNLLGISGYLFLGGVADLVIYSVDRAILAAFRPAAVVGLYEAPVRTHTLLQQVHSSLVTPVVAASAQFSPERDVERTRDLLVRGMRYTLAASSTRARRDVPRGADSRRLARPAIHRRLEGDGTAGELLAPERQLGSREQDADHSRTSPFSRHLRSRSQW